MSTYILYHIQAQILNNAGLNGYTDLTMGIGIAEKVSMILGSLG